ncbi:enolase-phosphatase E1 [Lithohypha guttulata]|uniref:Enolase-phosphatase E1 n=1 Tax=Lithohypha guttulata TaxID=1690604 RepID=A0AAN7YFP2_9EURO|nr:enolase-phosphatase E1 [Lithohypha guttulata]KAK5098268.1 enolase-phosphatase E1 [Lithohypha guttulata]
MAQDLSEVDTVLLDIEGTICPIEFVRATLFPYAIQALPKVLREKWDDPDFKPYRDAFPAEARGSPDALEAHVKDLTEQDVKIAYLKNLQGYLWQEGYETGSYSTPLFDDVIPTMQKWHDKGLSNSIYSSGSVFAQKLLFGHVKDKSSSNPGASINRQDLIHEWFDTVNAGPKTQTGSYEKIAEALVREPAKILFLSDSVTEIQAAMEAGMRTIVVERPGNSPLLDEDRTVYQVVQSLDQLDM